MLMVSEELKIQLSGVKMRKDGRQADKMRPVKIVPGFVELPAGSAMIEMGRTRVLCAASVEEKAVTVALGHFCRARVSERLPFSTPIRVLITKTTAG